MDLLYMKRALELAGLGRGHVNPNPLVGAVIVNNEGRIIGEGYHGRYGGDHAEIRALKNAREGVEGATIYLNLEPCSHFGKTPPCVEAIIKHGIKRVVVGMEDPNPLVAGRGIKILRERGIEVVSGLLEEEAKKLNEVFIKYIRTRLPFCSLKTAMTLDGKIASYTGDSRWITNSKSRQYVHGLRHEYSSIMVGIGTVLADDPLLTTRIEGFKGRNPIRIIVDSRGSIPLDARVLQCNEDTKTILATTELARKEKLTSIRAKGAEVLLTPLREGRVDLEFLVGALGERGIDSILLEGGSRLNYSALREGIVDKLITFIGPKIIGGDQAKTPVGGQGIAYMEEALRVENMELSKFDDDLMIEAYIKREV